MANADIPAGFDPTGIMYGLLPWEMDAGTATAAFRNDTFEMEADGNVRVGEAGNTELIGSIQGTSAATTAQKALVAASTAATILGTHDPSQLYLAQDDAAGTEAQTIVGNNADIVAGAGSTTTGLSAHEIGGGTFATTAAQFRMLDRLRRSDNTFGDNTIWLCVIAEHHYNNKIAGV